MADDKKQQWVLHVCTKLSVGGVQAFIMNYYKNIDRSKIQFAIAVQRNFNYDYDREIIEMGGRIHLLPDMQGHLFLYIKELKKLLLEHPEYSIIHCHMNQNNFIPLIIAKLVGIPVRISHSHSVFKTNNLLKKISYYIRKKIISFMATDIVACSNNAALSLYGKKNANKVRIIKNAIDIQKYIYNHNLRTKHRIELKVNDYFVIGHVGNFTPAKNYDFILDVFEIVNQLDKKVILVLVGDGMLKKYVQENVKSRGLEKKVLFLGKRKDVNELMQAFDLFLFPSKIEGLGIAAIEAQISGLPVITSDNVPKDVDITDLVKHISLSAGPKKWADEIMIMKQQNYDRSNIDISVDYDIKTNIDVLQSLYLKKTYLE